VRAACPKVLSVINTAYIIFECVLLVPQKVLSVISTAYIIFGCGLLVS
jgi:hypothetical protein